MKRSVTILLVLTMLMTALLPVMGASAMIAPQYVYTSNGKGLNIRSGPSKDYEVIGSIPYGAMVDSYQYYDGVWAYVTYRGTSGFAMCRYFVPEKPAPLPKPQPQPTAKPGGGGSSGDIFKGFTKASYYVTVRPSTPSGFVNLRWAPTKSHGIQNTYYAGYPLRVLAQNGTWAQVYDETNDICGFMMMSFLTVSGVGLQN